MDRRRHQHIRLAAGIAEHQALVAGAFILVVPTVDTHSDVGRLFVEIILKFKMCVMELILLVADVGNGAAHRILNGAHDPSHLVFGSANLATDDHAVCRCQRFTGNTRFRLGCQKQIEDGVGYTVAQLVWMSFGYGFRSEKIGHEYLRFGSIS